MIDFGEQRHQELRRDAQSTNTAMWCGVIAALFVGVVSSIVSIVCAIIAANADDLPKN